MMKRIKKWLADLFGTTPAPEPFVPPAPMPSAPSPTIDLSNWLNDWMISTWSAPGKSAHNTGSFSKDNVSVLDGVLCLKLSQSDLSPVMSVGAELTTKKKYGFGKYEFEVRASSTATTPTGVGSPVSGSITGIFNYTTSSATEIDVEVEGIETRSHLTQCTTWKGEGNPNEHSPVKPTNGLPHERFFKYAFIWSPTKIEFFRDDVLIAMHTKVVPVDEASVMLNHWGTNSVMWGGDASPGVDRFMYVKSCKFTPL